MIRKRLLFALATVVLGLGAIESLLALTGVTPLADERDPFAGFSARFRVFELDGAAGIYRTRPSAVVHSFHPEHFAAHKPEGGFRLFVIGGSSAFGFPWGASVAFPRLLGRALEASAPERTIETINAAAMSYGSHRLRILATELFDYEPDAIVIYGGHNEFIERRFYRDLIDRAPRLAATRSFLARSRIYSALARLYERARRRNEPNPGAQTTGELLGLDVVRENSTVGVAETAIVRESFEENLRAIVEAARRRGVRIVLCTVPSNLRDWAPNQSFFGAEVGAEARTSVRFALAAAETELGAGRAEAAKALLEAALDRAPRYAETSYRLAEAYEALGRFGDADRAYRAARDADAQPSRAPGAINDAIRAFAGEPGVTVVDVERSFVEASAHGLLGFDLFEDYVHPKPAGHRLIAHDLWRTIVEAGWLGADRAADPDAFERAAAGLAREGPAAGATTVRQLFNLAIVLENQGLDDEAAEKYRETLRREPGHHAARYNLARLLARAGRFAEAEREFRTALETARGQPMHAPILLGLGDSVRRQGRVAEAIGLYDAAVRTDPGSGPAWGRLGGALSEAGRLEEADRAYERALALDPRDVEAVAGRGYVALLEKRFGDAREHFERALRLRPDHIDARTGRAAVLVESGDLDEGERVFREVLREDPGNAMARGGLELIDRRRAATQKDSGS